MIGMRGCFLGGLLLLWAGMALAQSAEVPVSAPQSPQPQDKPTQGSQPATLAPGELPPSEAPPRSDDAVDDRNSSSSRENIIDLAPPKDDLKSHPDSAAAVAKAEEDDNAETTAADVQEFHQWNPMKSLKDVEIGDYYFKRKNYRAALDRYKEALFYKDNDAVATFRLAVCQEHMKDDSGALKNYLAYLKILPNGPFAGEAQDAVERLGGKVPTAAQTSAAEKP